MSEQNPVVGATVTESKVVHPTVYKVVGLGEMVHAVHYDKLWERVSKAEAENQRLRMALRPVSDAEINLHNPGCPEVFFANRILAERRKP